MAFREKRMAQNNWPAFQQSFEALFMNLGAPNDMALFGRTDPNVAGTEVMLLTGRTAEAEALSPGGGQDVEDSCQHKWALLVGHHGAEEGFGLELGF